MTKLSSIGTGIVNPDNKSTKSMLGAVGTDNKTGMVIQWQKPSDKGTYGWADPTYMEYQFWKAKNYGKGAQDFEGLTEDQKLENRKAMLKFYKYDTSKFTDEQLKDPSKFYTKEIISGKKGAKAKLENGILKNAEEIGLVGANQWRFNQEGFRPSASDDWKLGLEHLDEFTFNNKLALGEPVEDITIDEPIKPGEIPMSKPVPPDQWWLQDIIKTAGAFGDMMRLKKYMPWQATPDVYLPTPTFYDPNRELAANAEMANIGTQGAAMFAGPQSFNARFSQIQSNAGRNAADIMSRYNNLNVGVANDFAMRNAAMMNQYAQNKATGATQLYDKTVIANQQFDNAKNLARQNLRQSYIDAITNKNYTANLNDLFPQYAINPAVGGRIGFTEGRPITPDTPQENSLMKKAQEYLIQYPSFTPEQAFKAAQLELGYGSGNSRLPDDDYMQKMQMLQMGYPAQ
jgi:hypothetical protein